VNTTQQTGGTLGVALLNTVAASATSSWLASHRVAHGAYAAAVVHGYTTAFTISAVLLFAATAVSVLIPRTGAGGEPSLNPELEMEAA
jgi:hypothetical protein